MPPGRFGNDDPCSVLLVENVGDQVAIADIPGNRQNTRKAGFGERTEVALAKPSLEVRIEVAPEYSLGPTNFGGTDRVGPQAFQPQPRAPARVMVVRIIVIKSVHAIHPRQYAPDHFDTPAFQRCLRGFEATVPLQCFRGQHRQAGLPNPFEREAARGLAERRRSQEQMLEIVLAQSSDRSRVEIGCRGKMVRLDRENQGVDGLLEADRFTLYRRTFAD
ncbi:hypothetical protein ACFSTD_03500 [Novosphingobium colocasiae]